MQHFAVPVIGEVQIDELQIGLHIGRIIGDLLFQLLPRTELNLPSPGRFLSVRWCGFRLLRVLRGLGVLRGSPLPPGGPAAASSRSAARRSSSELRRRPA